MYGPGVCMDTKKGENEGSAKEPLGRRGACSFIYNDKFYLHSGYSGGDAVDQSAEPQLKVLDLSSGGCWSSEPTKIREGEDPHDLPECISGACCTVLNGCLYVFGGWQAGLRKSTVHELKLSSLTWRCLKEWNPRGEPLLKDKAGMVSYGKHMLCVFGGYGYPLQWQFGAGFQKGATYHRDESSGFMIYWTNELHLFDIPSHAWISPETTGVRPPPCAAFSFTKVDCSRVVLFAGRQQKERVNEVHILDMSNWHWSGVIMPSRPEEPWPCKRSFHAACSLIDPKHICVCSRISPSVTYDGDVIRGGRRSPLAPSTYEEIRLANPDPDQETILQWLHFPDLSHPNEGEGMMIRCDPKVLVMMGMDNNADPVSDAWVLNVNTLTWEKVTLPPESDMPGRIWHTMASHHPSPTTAEIVMFGGSNQNLFSTPEQLLNNISRTTVIHLGVPPLYDMTHSFIASNLSFFQPLLHQLPLSVQKAVKEEKETLQTLHDNCTVLRL